MRPIALIQPATGQIVVVNLPVMELVLQYRQLSNSTPESGGVLIGMRRGEHFEITTATKPENTDSRKRFRFKRRRQGHSETVRKRWVETLGYENYLGEWHTHPEDNPIPSKLDLNEWQKAAIRHEKLLVVMIVGRKSIYFSLVGPSGVSPLVVVGES